MRLRRLRIIAWLMVAAAWLGAVGTLAAQAPRPAEPAAPIVRAAQEPAPNLGFRRVYVPEERIGEFAGQGFYPFARQDFEQLVQLLTRDANAPPGLKAAAVRRAEFYAALRDGEFLRGHAVLEMERRRAGAVAIPLDPLNLTVASPYWKDTHLPASTGVDAEGRFVALARREKTLSFSWTLRGGRDPFGATEFSLVLPDAAIRRLVLDLPQELQLSAEGGIVHESQPAPAPDGDALELAPPDPGMRRWEVEVRGGAALQLRITPRSVTTPESSVALRRSRVYELAPQGLTLTEELRLFVQGAPLRELSLQVDSPLSVTAARVNDQPAPLEVSAEDPSITMLRFPEPILGEGHTIRLSAKGPAKLNQDWRLPGVRPQGVAWRSGQVQLRLADALVLQRLEPFDCIPTQTAPAAGQVGQSLTFRNYSEQAQLSVVVERRAPRVRAIVGTTLEIGPNAAAATTVFDLEADQGEQFLFLADVAPDWIVDSVAASLPDEGDREIAIHYPAQGAAGDAREPFAVRPSEALRPDNDLRLTVKAHRRLGGGAALTRSDVRAVVLRDVDETARYVAVGAESPFRIVLAEDLGLTRLDPTRLPEAAARRVTASPTSVVFEDAAAAPGLRIGLEAATPNLTAQIAMEAHVGRDSVREHYRIRVTPVSSRIDRVRVHFSQRRSTALVWRWEESPEQTLLAQRVEDETSEEGETWELTFDRGRDGPFTVEAGRVTPYTTACELSFPSLPQANTQQAELAIDGEPGVMATLASQGLKAIPAAPPGWGEYSTRFGAYRFEPAQQPAARIEAQRGPEHGPHAWAWSCRVVSRYALDGPSLHTAMFDLENAGRTSLLVSPPSGAAIRRVEVNGVATPLPAAKSPSQAVRIALPPRDRFPRLTIEYLTPPRRLGPIGAFSWAAPTLDAPVLAREWEVAVAPGLAIASVTDEGVATHKAPAWDERLLGIVRSGRASDVSAIQQGGDRTAAGAHDAPSDVSREGWESRRMTVTPSRAPQVRVYRRDVFAALAGGLFLIAAVATAWLMGRRGAWFWGAAALFGAAALATPAPYLAPATGLFLGVLAAPLLRLFAARTRQAAALASGDDSSTASLPAAGPATGMTMLAVAAIAAGLGAVRAYAQPEAAQTPTYQPVIVPLDDQGRVSQDNKYVYLPESLYQAFRQAAQRLDESPRSWLLRSVEYDAFFDWLPTGDEVGCERVAVELEVEAFSAPTRVVLPLPWRHAGVQEDSVRLDGEPLEAEWLGAEGGLAFEVERTGVFHLSLEIQPQVAEELENRSFDLPLLPSPQATLQVHYPGRVDDVEAATVLGAIHRDAATGEFTAELGPAARLALRWPKEPDEFRPSPRPPHVEQFTWLHIQPDALIVDAKWRFLGNGELVSALDVLADDNLLFLPSTARGLARFDQVRRGDRQSLRLYFDRPRATPFDFQISFVVQNAVGIGRPAAPWVEIQNADLARRWFAVSVDDTLEIGEIRAEYLEALAETRFRQDWGDGASSPQRAYRLLGSGASWSAQTQFRAAPLACEAQCETVYRRDAAEVLYRANLDPGQGPRVLLRLAAPPELRVEAVSVREGDVERVDHWSQNEAGEVTVFLNGRVTGAHQLEVRGRISHRPRGKSTLPQIQVQDAAPTQTIHRVYRSPEVALELASLEGMAPDPKAALGEYAPPRGRLAAVLTQASSVGGPAGNAVFELSPNRPRIGRKRLITTLTPRGETWEVAAEVEFQVNQGLVDYVRIDAPQSFAGPYSVEPPGQLETLDLAHQGRRILVVRPDRPLAGSRRIRVAGTLHTPPGESLRAPDVELLDWGDARQFLVLPRVWKGQVLAWEPYGLRAEPLPGADRDRENQVIAYQVVNKPHYGAVVRQAAQRIGDPRVRLLDVLAVVQDEKSFYARAVFDLEPAGLDRAIFELPRGARLVHAAVEGLAITPTNLGEGRYALDLGGERIPLRLTVVYRGQATRSESPDAAAILSTPVLVDLPVERTLWSVASALPRHAVSAADPANAIALPRQDLLRLRAWARLLDLPDEVEAERKPEELARWYLAWSRRWFAVYGPQKENEKAANSEGAGPSWQALDQEHASLAERYGAEEARSRAAAEAANLNKKPRPWMRPAPAVRAAFTGAAAEMTVRIEASHGDSFVPRLAAIVVAVAASCAGAWWFPRVHVAEGLARWAPLICVLAGLAWWLWLVPPVGGLVLIAAGAWLSLRTGLGTRRNDE